MLLGEVERGRGKGEWLHSQIKCQENSKTLMLLWLVYFLSVLGREVQHFFGGGEVGLLGGGKASPATPPDETLIAY